MTRGITTLITMRNILWIVAKAISKKFHKLMRKEVK